VDTSRWRQIERVFHSALTRSSGERETYLTEACREDAHLRTQVDRLLRAHDTADSFMEAPPEAVASEARRTQSAMLGARFGDYRVLRVIAAGGMGTVYEARHEPTGRFVALKILRALCSSPDMRRRFEREARLLGQLRHPAIARVFEAGVSEVDDQPVPFIAMELLGGARTLVEYAASAGLSLRQRLELFLQVCDAVQYAHSQGVIHRDLKPGNVLVIDAAESSQGLGVPAASDSDGALHAYVKVIDFGVARALDADGAAASLQTYTGQLVGTVPYMSPEQCGGDREEVGAQSDVYSLGVLLFELLTGLPPYEVRGKSILEAVRVIQWQPPMRPSLADPSLRGDLETILLKALEKEKSARYPSVAQLASDIQRFLDHRRIVAQRPGIVRQLRVLGRRHRALFTAAIVVGLGLLASAVISIAFAVRAGRVAASEAAMRAEAQRVTSFLQEMLLSVDPAGATASATFREMLDNASARLERDFTGYPLVAGAIHADIGESYRSIGAFDVAERHQRESLALLQRFGGPAEHQALVRARLATILCEKAQYPEADAMIREAIAIQRGLGPAGHADLAASLTTLARSLKEQGHLDDARRIYEEALTLTRDAYGPAHMQVARVLGNLGGLVTKQGHFDEAQRMLEEALAISTKALGPDHIDVATSLNNLAGLMVEKSSLNEAVRLSREALAIMKKRRREAHPATARALATLSAALLRTGDLREAETVLRESVDIQTRLLGLNHPDTALSMSNLGFALKEQGQYGEAEKLYQQALAVQESTWGPDHPDLAYTLIHLGMLSKIRGDYAAAEPLFRRAVAIRRAGLGADHPFVAYALNNLGEMLFQARRLPEARAVLDEAAALSVAKLGKEHWLTSVCRSNTALIDLAEGDDLRAEEALRQVLRHSEALYGPEHVNTAFCRYNLALALQRQSRYAEARILLENTLQIGRTKLGDEHPRLAMPMVRLGAVLLTQGEAPAAEHLLQEARRRLAATLDSGHWQLAYVAALIGECQIQSGEMDDGEALLRESFEQLRHELGEHARETEEIACFLEALAAEGES
jgi:serine/threonine protein kinase/Tfp pilus assembly protein PilF